MSAGGSSSSGSTKFARNGTVQTSSWRDLTNEQNGLFDNAFGMVNDGPTNQAVTSSLNTKMGRSWSDVPYGDAVCQVTKDNLPGQAIPGYASLQSQASVDPYSAEYANNTFGRYQDEVLRMIGQARSGPMSGRGGEAAQGYMMSDVVGKMGLDREQVLATHRAADAQIQQQASQTLGQHEGRMDGMALQGAQTGFGGFFNLLQDQSTAATIASDRAKAYGNLVPTFASLASKMQGLEQNNLSGHGSQSSGSMGVGLNLCCFIFLEAYNGVLPESVRRYRDMAAPESSARRNGYRKMSKWLVPAMRVNGLARTLTNHLLVKPLTKYGEWFYGNNKTGWIFWPVKQFWFSIWNLTGKEL